MSGGSGKYISGEELSTLRQRALESASNEAEDARINQLLDHELASVDQRDTNSVRAKLDIIREVIGDLLEEQVDLIFGGSIAKHTYVDGLSDVDALVVLDGSRLGAEAPGDLVRDFATALRERLGPIVESVEGGSVAVTVKFADGIAVDVLPALRRGSNVSIARPDGDSWINTRPSGFARKLQSVNEQMGGRLYKTIKLVKSLMTTLPESRRLSGYHLESLAIEAFEGYSGNRTPSAMLRHFFQDASVRVLTPIRDSTGQSVHVDGDLGPARSLDRRLRADSLSKMSRRMEAATTANQWRSLLEETDT